MELQKKRRYTRRTCAAFAGPIHRTTEIRGLGAAARRCGCSHTHLRKVLEGERKPSADLERRMRRMGLFPGSLKKEAQWVKRESEENFRSPLPDARVCAGSSRPCESARHGAAGEADEGRTVR